MVPQPPTSVTQKRKRNILPLDKKIEIIEKQLKKGATAVALCTPFNVPRTTINDIKKKPTKLSSTPLEWNRSMDAQKSEKL